MPLNLSGSFLNRPYAAGLRAGVGIAVDRSGLFTTIRQDLRDVAPIETVPLNGLVLIQDAETGRFGAINPANLPGGGGSGGGGVSPSLSGTTAAPVSGQRALRLNLSGGLVHASASDTSVAGRVVGISRTAAIAGAEVEYAFGGSMTDSAWNWNPGPVYLGENGTLTQAVPNSGVFYPLGTSDRPTRILISIGPSIRL